jgi:flagellar FliL protein
MAQDPASVESTPKKSKKKLIIIVIFLMLAIGGGVAYFMFFKNNKAAQHEDKVEAEKPPIFLPLESFTVNLQPYPDEQFLQISITLQVTEPADEELFKLHMPEIRNRLLLLLSSKQSSEISSNEGKKILSNEIIDRIKIPFAGSKIPQKINGVFFTSFIVQ